MKNSWLERTWWFMQSIVAQKNVAISLSEILFIQEMQH